MFHSSFRISSYTILFLVTVSIRAASETFSNQFTFRAPLHMYVPTGSNLSYYIEPHSGRSLLLITDRLGSLYRNTSLSWPYFSSELPISFTSDVTVSIIPDPSAVCSPVTLYILMLLQHPSGAKCTWTNLISYIQDSIETSNIGMKCNTPLLNLPLVQRVTSAFSLGGQIRLTGFGLGKTENDSITVNVGDVFCSNSKIIAPEFVVSTTVPPGTGQNIPATLSVNSIQSVHSVLFPGSFSYKDIQIPQVMVLNVNRTYFRWEISRDRLRGVGIEPMRFEALDMFNNSTAADKVLADVGLVRGQMPSVAELAITASHLGAWKLADKLNLPAVWVFEDDLFLAHDFVNDFSAAWGVVHPLIPRKIDVVQVGWCDSWPRCLQPSDLTFCQMGFCLQSYIISQNAIRKLMPFIASQPHVIDYSMWASKKLNFSGELTVCQMTGGRHHEHDYHQDGRFFGGGISLQDRSLPRSRTDLPDWRKSTSQLHL